MTATSRRFEVPAEDLAAFVSALTLGTLEAMRAGAWPLDSGIWSLGRPAFHSAFSESLPEALRTILDEADELCALAKLSGRDAADARLDELIAILRDLLPKLHGSWSAAVT